MRENKFRAWYDKSNTFVYFHIGKPMTDDSLKIYHELCLSGSKFYEYTGLKDKHGVEIYEGDILMVGDYLIEEVKWIGLGDWMGDKQPMVGFIAHETIYGNKPIKVIGNIYKNPELLETKKEDGE